MAYQVNGTASDFKRTFEQFQHANAQLKQIKQSFSQSGIHDLESYVADVLRANQREQDEAAAKRYIIPSVCSKCGK